MLTSRSCACLREKKRGRISVLANAKPSSTWRLPRNSDGNSDENDELLEWKRRITVERSTWRAAVVGWQFAFAQVLDALRDHHSLWNRSGWHFECGCSERLSWRAGRQKISGRVKDNVLKIWIWKRFNREFQRKTFVRIPNFRTTAVRERTRTELRTKFREREIA